MIKRVRHKGLERLIVEGDARGLDSQMTGKIRRILTALEAAETPADMNAPAYRLHQLKGDRRGQWAISVSGNWRIVFEFDGTDATNVDLVDYH